MEVAEEMLWTYASRFMGMRWAGEVIYGTDYESHDTNYRIAVMKQAKELIPENELINGMILKEVVELLAPAEQRHDYQQALFPTLPIIMQQLEEECETEVYTRDIGSQIPVEEEEEGEEENGEYEEEDNEEVMMPTGDGITYTGASYYTQDAIAAQITGQNIGR